MPKPNVLIFCCDEFRADYLRCAGNRLIKTPNLDRLASRGVLFQRSYATNPICMPARASMFTGLLPRDHGVRVNGQGLRKDLPTLPGILAEAGYRTHVAGKLHLTPWVPREEPPRPDLYPECLDCWRKGLIDEFPLPYYGFQTVDFVGGHTSYAYGEYLLWLKEQGGDPALLTLERALPAPLKNSRCYKMSLPEALHYNRFVADSTISLIKEAARSHQPFFSWCSFPDPHGPVAPPWPYCDLYDPADIPVPPRREGEAADLPPYYARVLAGEIKIANSDPSNITDDEWREAIALTYGMVTHLDHELGRVLDSLDASGLASNTLVVFLADHGETMGDHGLVSRGPYTWGSNIRIPTIVSAPGMLQGVVSDALISQVDLMPSVLEYCAVPMPGSDWVEVETPFERGSVAPLHTHPGRSWLGLLDSSAARIRESVVIENDCPATGYRARCLVTDRYRLTVYPGTSDGELFDLSEDPDELHNLWYSPKHKNLKADLIAGLLSAYSLHTPFHPIPPWNS